MFYEVEVVAEGNSPMELNRVFSLLEEPRSITQLLAPTPSGPDGWCDVTGWSESGPCPAYAAKAEDSGEGAVLLIYGGDWGIRLRPENTDEEWDLDNAGQWGEPCLMLGPDTPTRP